MQAYKEALRNHLCSLYKLKEPEEKAYADLRKAAENIQLWVSKMLNPEFNSFGIIFKRAIATGQD